MGLLYKIWIFNEILKKKIWKDLTYWKSPTYFTINLIGIRDIRWQNIMSKGTRTNIHRKIKLKPRISKTKNNLIKSRKRYRRSLRNTRKLWPQNARSEKPGAQIIRNKKLNNPPRKLSKNWQNNPSTRQKVIIWPKRLIFFPSIKRIININKQQ